MTFLPMNTGTPGGFAPPEGAYLLAAGTHETRLSKLAFNAKSGKVIAEFTTPDGLGSYTEWLGMDSDAQKKRLAAFIGHLCDMAGLGRPGDFDSVAQFDQFGKALVVAGTALWITLFEEEYQGKARVKLAAAYFDKCIFGVDPGAGTASGF